jgi:hypothetical protein
MPELPSDVRAMVLTMSSFGSNGFKNVKTLQVCIVRLCVHVSVSCPAAALLTPHD